MQKKVILSHVVCIGRWNIITDIVVDGVRRANVPWKSADAGTTVRHWMPKKKDTRRRGATTRCVCVFLCFVVYPCDLCVCVSCLPRKDGDNKKGYDTMTTMSSVSGMDNGVCMAAVVVGMVLIWVMVIVNAWDGRSRTPLTVEWNYNHTRQRCECIWLIWSLSVGIPIVGFDGQLIWISWCAQWIEDTCEQRNGQILWFILLLKHYNILHILLGLSTCEKWNILFFEIEY